MLKDPEGLKMWRALHDQWKETQERALAGRAELTSKQLACVKGTGPDPTVAEIDAVESLERTAAKLANEMDNFVKHRLG
ncbi:hypothetical protein J7E70_33510 [Variovorax paradoxus]|nr:hypothetical protein [Variovorax paradoxus]MBT2305322.1 hypothetical protein [Variovorax paradoxus]